MTITHSPKRVVVAALLSGGLTLAILEEFYASIVNGRPLYHDGVWGRATLEVVLALITSARERREIRMSRQVAMPDSYDAELPVIKVGVS